MTASVAVARQPSISREVATWSPVVSAGGPPRWSSRLWKPAHVGLNVPAVADEALVEHVLQAGLGGGREAVPLGDDQRARLDPHGAREDPGFGRGRLAQRDVDGLQPAPRVAARERELPEGDLALGVSLGERVEQLVRDERRRRPDEADLEHALRSARERLGGEADLALGLDHGARLLEERSPCVGQPYPLGVAFEQLQAELALELGDRLRERRLGDEQLLCGTRDLTLVCDGDEVAQLVGLQGHPGALTDSHPPRPIPSGRRELGRGGPGNVDHTPPCITARTRRGSAVRSRPGVPRRCHRRPGTAGSRSHRPARRRGGSAASRESA